MMKQKVLNDIKSLIDEIDKCTEEFSYGSLVKWDDLDVTHVRMLNLLAKTYQELTFLYDHIKVLYGLEEKADQVYFRANSLSADINSSEALRKAMEDYWHYVKLVVDKPINMDEP